jgi:hypothetical protein
MLFAAQAVASSMTCSSPPTCGTPGMLVTAPTEQIIDVLASDTACAGVVPNCQATDDAGACTQYYVLPVAAGNCHLDVDLQKGTRFSDDVKVIAGPTGCAGFYPAIGSDSNIVVP